MSDDDDEEINVSWPLVKIMKAHSRIELPKYESAGASGIDLHAFLDSDLTIPAMGRLKIPTGLRLQIPDGFEAQVRPRSGLALNSGLTVLNSPGTIDSDYRGDLEVILVNLGNEEVVVKDGDRIAQLVIAQVCHVKLEQTQELSETERGDGGFGSTGI